MGRLDGKVAIITGGGRGLGRGYALLFAKEGAKVVVNDIDALEADQVVKEIQKLGGSAISCYAAAGTKQAAEELVKVADNAFGRLDILVNNAGPMEAVTPALELEEKVWDMSIEVHLKGSFLNCQAAAKYMIAHNLNFRIFVHREVLASGMEP